MSKITTFYSDKEKTNALYPITKTNAIYDNNNVNLEQRLNEVLKLQMDLLWTNASPTSEFAPQTISLDISAYKLLCIDFRLWNTVERFVSYIADIKLPNHSFGAFVQNFIVYREFDINSNNILFGAGSWKFTQSSEWIASDNACIPFRIYGVK